MDQQSAQLVNRRGARQNLDNADNAVASAAVDKQLILRQLGLRIRTMGYHTCFCLLTSGVRQ